MLCNVSKKSQIRHKHWVTELRYVSVFHWHEQYYFLSQFKKSAAFFHDSTIGLPYDTATLRTSFRNPLKMTQTACGWDLVQAWSSPFMYTTQIEGLTTWHIVLHLASILRGRILLWWIATISTLMNSTSFWNYVCRSVRFTGFIQCDCYRFVQSTKGRTNLFAWAACLRSLTLSIFLNRWANNSQPFRVEISSNSWDSNV